VFLTQAAWNETRKAQVSSILAAQMLMNPAAGVEAMFQKAWLKFTDIRPATLNVYIMCDPASSRKKNSDRTAILVVGIDAGRNRYLLDGYAHKMGLAERWTKLRDLRAHWSSMPGVQTVNVGYERYGLNDALEHFEERMEIEKLGFPIQELAWVAEGGNAKYDRIQRLEPDYRNGKWFLPAENLDADGLPVPGETRNQRALREAGQAYRIMAPIRRMDHEGKAYSLVALLLDEYLVYPYVTHDDVLDCQSRLYDMNPVPPVLIDASALEPEVFADGS
jgi:hypothetical protein